MNLFYQSFGSTDNPTTSILRFTFHIKSKIRSFLNISMAELGSVIFQVLLCWHCPEQITSLSFLPFLPYSILHFLNRWPCFGVSQSTIFWFSSSIMLGRVKLCSRSMGPAPAGWTSVLETTLCQCHVWTLKKKNPKLWPIYSQFKKKGKDL